MLNISAKRLDRTTSFNFVDNLIDGKETDIKIFVYPLNSKAHRDALEEIERLKESGEQVEGKRLSAIVAAYLFDAHEGLEDDGKPLEVSDKMKTADLLMDEPDLFEQIIQHAKKKSNWMTEPKQPKNTSKK